MIIPRAAFTGIFGLAVFGLSTYALRQLLGGAAPTLSWLGLLIAAITPLSFLVYHGFSKASKNDNPVGFSMFCGLGVAICMAASWKYGNAAGMIHIWAGSCLVGWVLYLKWLKDPGGKTSISP